VRGVYRCGMTKANWDELVAQQQAQIEAEQMQQVMAQRAGFWSG